AFTLAACAAALATAAAASATPRFGVAEDATKYADDGGASLYPKLTALGMDTNRMSVRWDPADPTTIQERGFLDRALPAAAQAGIHVILAVYPSDRYAFTAGSPELRATLFGAYLQTLARRYPQVTDFIVGNEPNERYFWRPQFGPGKRQVSAAAFLRMMTAAYDALKSVDPKLRVIAAGPSNEGNDKTSTSPMRFIAALGDAYRESARSTPFMDAMGFHIYPRNNTHPPSKRYSWPNIGPSDLARVKQAVWDAFADTPQPTFAQSVFSSEGSLGLVVDEFGWQVAIGPRLAARYTKKENVPTITEAEQAEYYSRLIRTFACDIAVTDALIFHLVDEADLKRFQSGLLRINRSKRPAYGAVAKAIRTAGACGSRANWKPARGVIGAKAIFETQDHPADRTHFGISVAASEDAVAKAGIFRTSGPGTRPQPGEVARSLAASSGELTPALRVARTVKAGYTPRIEFRGSLEPGHYVYGVHLRAAVKPGRTRTFLSSTFEIQP
ncbi:MAG: hypothetical protein ACRDMW_09930, partial [Gaiellaceae bacterium]